MIAALILSLGLQLLGNPDTDLETSEADAEFSFYLKEMVAHEMTADAPMSKLIYGYLIEATFNTTSEKVFKNRLRLLQRAQQENPNRSDRFQMLDRSLSRVFDKRLAEAKTKRLIYAGAGAVIGALVAIPIGRAINSSARTLLIAIPSGALLGAGAGFLLGQLLVMPHYTYEAGMVNNWDMNEVSEFLGENSN